MTKCKICGAKLVWLGGDYVDFYICSECNTKHYGEHKLQTEQERKEFFDEQDKIYKKSKKAIKEMRMPKSIFEQLYGDYNGNHRF